MITFGRAATGKSHVIATILQRVVSAQQGAAVVIIDPTAVLPTWSGESVKGPNA